MSTLRRLCLAALLAATAAVADAEVARVTPFNALHIAPGVGEWEIARVDGPGVFVAGSITALGVNPAQVAGFVAIDGRVLWIAPLGAAGARLGGQVNAGLGIVYHADLDGSAKASFGLAEPLRFERELRVYVRVEAGTPMRVFGSVLVGAAAP